MYVLRLSRDCEHSGVLLLPPHPGVIGPSPEDECLTLGSRLDGWRASGEMILALNYQHLTASQRAHCLTLEGPRSRVGRTDGVSSFGSGWRMCTAKTFEAGDLKVGSGQGRTTLRSAGKSGPA